jgi:hypothetical protein
LKDDRINPDARLKQVSNPFIVMLYHHHLPERLMLLPIDPGKLCVVRQNKLFLTFSKAGYKQLPAPEKGG